MASFLKRYNICVKGRCGKEDVEATFIIKKMKGRFKCNRHYTCMYLDLYTSPIVLECSQGYVNAHVNITSHLNIITNSSGTGNGGVAATFIIKKCNDTSKYNRHWTCTYLDL